MSHPEKAKTETITPVQFSRKDRRAKPPGSRQWIALKFFALAVVLLLMVAGGAWLIGYLSKKPVDSARIGDANVKIPGHKAELAESSSVTPESKREGASVETAAGQPAETVDPAELAFEKENAEQKLADFTLARNELERRGASEWGGDLYAEMIQISQEADASLIDKDYVTAFEKYSLATARANELAGQIEVVFRQMMEKGRIALDEGDGEGARKGFRLALMIDPENESAQHGLERAQKVEAVTQLIEAGKRHEENGNFSFAHADYREAMQIDPESEEAQEGFGRVKDQIKNEEFQQLISEGLAAYHKNDFQLARNKLLKAKSFKPESKEVSHALAQVDQGIRSAKISGLKKRALRAEKKEAWKEALESYLAVLKIDKTVQFAVQGKERSLGQIQIDKRVGFFLQNPSVLDSDRQLDNAVLLVREVEIIEPKGPRRTAELEQLRQLVTSAQTPVKLIIESDNLTEVVIYRIGKLGRFDVQELDLRPGTYTVVGERDGYKDIRHEIVIKPGKDPLRISIKCEVEI
ncbi:MAG: hypothetical protein JRI47_00225 [Deltaproteobacteria bacterium]|nr:hypothetical protein [Deltaproteobacteria bacterium]